MVKREYLLESTFEYNNAHLQIYSACKYILLVHRRKGIVESQKETSQWLFKKVVEQSREEMQAQSAVQLDV